MVRPSSEYLWETFQGYMKNFQIFVLVSENLQKSINGSTKTVEVCPLNVVYCRYTAITNE